MVERSEVVFKEVDYDIAARYLGEVVSVDEIKAEGFEEIVYTKKKVERKPRKTKTRTNLNKPTDKTCNYDVAIETNETKEHGKNNSEKGDDIVNGNENIDKISNYDVALEKESNDEVHKNDETTDKTSIYDVDKKSRGNETV